MLVQNLHGQCADTYLNCHVQIFCSVALILGDGLYNIIKITTITLLDLYQRRKALNSLPTTNAETKPKKSKFTMAVGELQRLPCCVRICQFGMRSQLCCTCL